VTDLHWVNCPFCGEISNLRRLGLMGNIVRTTSIVRHPGNKDPDFMKLLHSKIVECLTCGHKFRTENATIFEAMGRDTVGNYPTV